jgi:glucosamine-6-phosphate deaminase
MQIIVLNEQKALGQLASKLATQLIKKAITANGKANIILATGTSQLETLAQLVREKDIEWGKVVMFHLDEYIGLPESSPASFRKYLKERFLDKLPALKAVHLINGEAPAEEECERLKNIITDNPIDVAFVGIGENGHLAFNDPPADFNTEEPYIIVDLDEQCRNQQLHEGWFESIESVPKSAISMSVKQIFKSKHIICSVPGNRKAKAVKSCLEGMVNNQYPASILQLHQSCTCFLDNHSSVLLSTDTLQKTLSTNKLIATLEN